MPAAMLASALILSFSQEMAILNAETGKPKKIIEKKKYLHIINLLKEFIEATTITVSLSFYHLSYTYLIFVIYSPFLTFLLIGLFVFKNN